MVHNLQPKHRFITAVKHLPQNTAGKLIAIIKYYNTIGGFWGENKTWKK